MEGREGWNASEKVTLICSLKDGEGQGPSRFGVGPEPRARESLGLSVLSCLGLGCQPALKEKGPSAPLCQPWPCLLLPLSGCLQSPVYSLLACVSSLNAVRVETSSNGHGPLPHPEVSMQPAPLYSLILFIICGDAHPTVVLPVA